MINENFKLLFKYEFWMIINNVDEKKSIIELSFNVQYIERCEKHANCFQSAYWNMFIERKCPLE